MKPIFGYVLGAFLATGLAAAVLLFTPLGKRPLDALFPIGDIEPVDFQNLRLSDKPNQYLVCPPGYCGADAHTESGEFEVSAERLRRAWQQVVASEPRVELLAHEGGVQFDYVQRSARFRFPDIITVRFIALSPSRSTLAVYSRSVHGYSDFGVNQQRIENWLTKLRAVEGF